MAREIEFDYGCSLLGSVLSTNVTDSCDCPCSSAGCTLFTTWLKGFVNSGIYEYGHKREEFGNNSAVWDNLPENMVTELLRFFTFEMLEMTHTCCRPGLLSIRVYCPPRKVVSMMRFRGNVEEIQEDGEELVQRLEDLLVEFEAHDVRGLSEVQYEPQEYGRYPSR